MSLKNKTITYKRILDKRFLLDKPNNSYIKTFINGRKHFYSSSARAGLLLLIDMLGIRKGEEVLLPAFSPEGLILPFKKRNIVIKYYSLEDNLDPNLSDVKRVLKDSAIKLFVVIHYFGLITNIEGVRNLVSKNIPILEDCAQAFLAKDRNGDFLGQKGDIALFSFPKFLPVPDGSLIVFNDKKLYSNNVIHSRPGPFITLARISGRLSILFKSIQAKKNWAKSMQLLSSFFYIVYYNIICWLNKPYNISSYSYSRLNKFAYNIIIKRRLSNINYYNAKFNDYNLGTNAPGYVIKVSNREKLQKVLKRKGIESLIYNKKWFYYGKPVKYCQINEPSLISTHLLLPINENYDYDDLKVVIDTVTNNLIK